MKKTLTCIVCPLGCQLEAEIENEKIISVTGNTCKRGATYAENEITNPKRVITTTVRTVDGRIIPVKTNKAIPKDLMFECMKVINALCPETKDYRVGDVLCESVMDTDADVVVCANVQGK